MLMLCALCLVRSCHFEIEQPGSSTFIFFPYLTWMTRVLEKFIPIEVHRLWGPQLLIQVVWNPTFFVFSHACPKPRYPMKTLPSWMAWYGSRTAKSTLLIGTTLEPQVSTNAHPVSSGTPASGSGQVPFTKSFPSRIG